MTMPSTGSLTTLWIKTILDKKVIQMQRILLYRRERIHTATLSTKDIFWNKNWLVSKKRCRLMSIEIMFIQDRGLGAHSWGIRQASYWYWSRSLEKLGRGCAKLYSHIREQTNENDSVCTNQARLVRHAWHSPMERNIEKAQLHPLRFHTLLLPVEWSSLKGA